MNFLTLIRTVAFVSLVIVPKLLAQTLTVGLEPFPPFVDRHGKGLTINMFHEIEKISTFRFDVKMMTYARAKHELSQGRLTIAGHTPKALETESFYQYAQDLNWQINTTSDLFAFDPQFLTVQNIKSGRIGTTLGNAHFFADILGIEKERFVEVKELGHLISLFKRGRVDVMLFERASVMTLLQQRKIENVYYKSIGNIPASIAVAKTPAGDKLKAQLDQLITLLDTDKIFSSYLKYSRLPEAGKVPAPD